MHFYSWYAPQMIIMKFLKSQFWIDFFVEGSQVSPHAWECVDSDCGWGAFRTVCVRGSNRVGDSSMYRARLLTWKETARSFWVTFRCHFLCPPPIVSACKCEFSMWPAVTVQGKASLVWRPRSSVFCLGRSEAGSEVRALKPLKVPRRVLKRFAATCQTERAMSNESLAAEDCSNQRLRWTNESVCHRGRSVLIGTRSHAFSSLTKDIPLGYFNSWSTGRALHSTTDPFPTKRSLAVSASDGLFNKTHLA